jgi:hypothetical protein
MLVNRSRRVLELAAVAFQEAGATMIQTALEKVNVT